jgi:hypothetical protein
VGFRHFHKRYGFVKKIGKPITGCLKDSEFNPRKLLLKEKIVKMTTIWDYKDK